MFGVFAKPTKVQETSLGSRSHIAAGRLIRLVPFDVETGLLGKITCVVLAFLQRLFICDPLM